ncbi:MAG: hypothetical protein OSB18_14545, partial [SAR324 cluster bacterium]|nr:hypothetical protein [SAR324 cluster bacterium]
RLSNTFDPEQSQLLIPPGYLFINHGFAERRCNRGSGGVGFVLSPLARKAWEAAGCKVLHFGERIAAVKLLLKDGKGRPLTIMLASAYAPHGSGPVKRKDRAVFLEQLGS